MLEEILHYLHNDFPTEVRQGTFTVENGALDTDFLAEGQFFRIRGSIFNDGVYRFPAEGLTDETFDGSVTAMAVPPELTAIAAEAAAWQEKYQPSPYQSEKLGDYSYTRMKGADWRAVFGPRLSRYRKIGGSI